jgi:uncharacterized protein YcaQ
LCRRIPSGILRHRVKGYRAGDLERRYASLDIEEDVLYAYGFLPRSIWQMLHPRDLKGMSKLEKNVLDVVREFGAMHPRELEAHFGNARIVNPWGGYSKATTHALEHLHYHGMLRIARREKGIRIYEVACPIPGHSHMSLDRRRFPGEPKQGAKSAARSIIWSRQVTPRRERKSSWKPSFPIL